MISVVGTISNSINMAVMNSKWQQKKQDINAGRKELTAQERELQFFQQQADSIRENKKPADIDAKLASGAKLTPDEIQYLRKNAPQALKEYEDLQREKAAYKKQLQNCKSKEEVEKLKINKMGEFLAATKEIASNPHIPKGKKVQMLKKILKQVAGIDAVHEEFIQSSKYQSLPEKTVEEDKEKDENAVSGKEQENADEITAITPETDIEEVLKEIKKSISSEGIIDTHTDLSISEQNVYADGDISAGQGQSTSAGVDIYV